MAQTSTKEITTPSSTDNSISNTSSLTPTYNTRSGKKSFWVTKEVQKLEGEVCFGVGWPVGSYHGGKSVTGMSLGLALRYNIEDSPVDMGVFLNLDCAYRDFYKRPDASFNQNNRSLVFGVSAAYNFRQGTLFNPFAGIGIGVAHNDVVGSRHYPSSGYSLAFVPKIGVELLYHIRLSFYADFNRRGYHMYGLSLGFVIGGRPK